MAKKNEKTTAKKIQKKREMDKETLENTMKIRIDRERLEDSESLDTSFLEGRVHKKAQDNKKVKEEILREKKESGIPFSVLKILLALVLLIIIIFVFQIVFITPNNREEEVIKEDNVVQKEDSIIDRNYLFVGDYHTLDFDLEDLFLENYYVKSVDKKLTTTSLLDNIKSMIYVYNPSIVFIEVGMNDLLEERDMSDILDDMGDIIKKIQDNRPYARIYVESLYPINKDFKDFDSDYEEIDYSEIEDYNEELKDLCSTLNVSYLDIYKEISENHELKKKYTDDGVTLNALGYEKVYKVIRNVVDEEK
ncbi:MAG: hypothetical protein IJJ63_02385 [Bacilli bacterium]|nr:hypothetical protein [Bacilli bacterium]